MSRVEEGRIVPVEAIEEGLESLPYALVDRPGTLEEKSIRVTDVPPGHPHDTIRTHDALDEHPELRRVGSGDHADIMCDRVPDLPEDRERSCSCSLTMGLLVLLGEQVLPVVAEWRLQETPETLIYGPVRQPRVRFAECFSHTTRRQMEG
jgi:hypothetical protein